MCICAAGGIHGAMDQLYADVLALEDSLGVGFDHVPHVGDFGVWPDRDRIDKATRKHEGAGDFPVWFAEGRAAPRPTVFIKLAPQCSVYASSPMGMLSRYPQRSKTSR